MKVEVSTLGYSYKFVGKNRTCAYSIVHCKFYMLSWCNCMKVIYKVRYIISYVIIISFAK